MFSVRHVVVTNRNMHTAHSFLCLYGQKLDRCIVKQDYQDHLQDQDGGHAVDKGKMPCLMPEGIHAGDGTDAAADQGNEKEGGFRNPESTLDCLSLVNAHQAEARQVDQYHIGYQT